MLGNMTESGLVTAVLEAVPDIDRPGDLKRLEHRLKHNLYARRLAPATWRFIERMKLPPVAREKVGRTIGSAIPNAAARFRTGRRV
jgi:hypothetical protein